MDSYLTFQVLIHFELLLCMLSDKGPISSGFAHGHLTMSFLRRERKIVTEANNIIKYRNKIFSETLLQNLGRTRQRT